MVKQKHMTVPHERAPFYLYLRVVRGHSVKYAATLAQAVRTRNTNSRTARNHLKDFQTRWWEFPEAEEGFNLWPVVGVEA